jgi:hypothetical protein
MVNLWQINQIQQAAYSLETAKAVMIDKKFLTCDEQKG